MLRRVGVRGCATQTRRGTRSLLRRAHAELIDWRRSAGLLEANCAGERVRRAGYLRVRAAGGRLLLGRPRLITGGLPARRRMPGCTPSASAKFATLLSVRLTSPR